MSITRTRIRIGGVRLALAGFGLTTALLVAACGSGNSGGTNTNSMPSMMGMEHGTTTAGAPTRTDFDAADVTFLQMMYPHHAQAVDMAQLVPSRTGNQPLITLARQIEQAQAPQMQQFAALLSSFGKPAPSATMGHEMAGMMPADQMAALGRASGPDFDRMWLQMMIQHHQGAIDMSNTELGQGANADTKALAQSIITAQQAEITQMRGMLGQN
jgi:uncharacterized protein (DUF305 family)